MFKKTLILLLLITFSVFTKIDASEKTIAAIYSFKGSVKISKDKKNIKPVKFKALESGTIISVGGKSEIILILKDGSKYQIQKKSRFKLTEKGLEGMNAVSTQMIKDGKKSVTDNDTMVFSNSKKPKDKDSVSEEVKKEIKQVDESTDDPEMRSLLKVIIYKSNGLFDLADQEYKKYLELQKK